MDRKLSLNPDSLVINSFATERVDSALTRTENKLALGLTLTTCDPYGACNTRNTCTTNLC
jgi:hypothetical protein